MLFANPNENVQEISNQMMIFDTQANRTLQKTTNLVYLVLLLSGSFYFAFIGYWLHALVCAILAVITFGATWLIFLLFAPDIRKQFIQRVLGRNRLFVTSSNVKP
jgi:hypothetical protein